MIKRILRIASLCFVILTFVVVDATIPLIGDVPLNEHQVLAQSKKKRRSTRRRRSGRRRRSSLRPGKRIPRERVLEIQRALIERGFLKKATGTYDTATVEAMKAFQASKNIEVTGYPTAHALHRLELSPGPTPKTSTTSKVRV